MSASSVDTRELILLAEELEALIRAGVPIGSGLHAASSRWNSGLSQAASRLADRLDQGTPLLMALETADEFPPIFRSVMAAGLKTERSADVLAAFATNGRQMLDLKSSILRGMMYPMMLTGLALLLAVAMLIGVLPEYGRTLQSFRIEPPAWYPVAERIRLAIDTWGATAGIALIVGLVAFAIFFRVSSSSSAGLLSSGFGRRVLRDLHMAGASRTLALLIENDVPLSTALRLTSDIIGPPRIARRIRIVADTISSGTVSREAGVAVAALPPLWKCLLSARQSTADLARGLHQAADLYAARAEGRAEFLGRVLPTVLTCVFGGGLVLLYATALFLPLSQLWQGMGVAR